MIRRPLLVLLVFVAGCEAVRPPAPPRATSPTPPKMSEPTNGSVMEEVFGVTLPTPNPVKDVVKSSLPTVLLVWNQRVDGKIGFGSAILLAGNLALTNRHVVERAKSLSVMFYDANRPNHSGIAEEGGGLRRYVFENEKSLVGAELLRDDPVADLAILRIKGDTSAYPRLTWRAEPPKLGERVFAVGHPAENAWSFTTGVVSNAHVNAIQIDAAINVGNSGGPLIDERGRLLGVNTLRALGGAQGIGYARPIAAARDLIDGVSRAALPDLSTPEKARLSCAEAAELAAEGWVECEDVEAGVELLQRAEERALTLLAAPSGLRKAFTAGHSSRSEWIAALKAGRIAWLRRHENPAGLARTPEAAAGKNPFEGLGLPALRAMVEKMADAKRRVEATHATMFQELEKRTGLKKKDGSPFVPVERNTLRMGQRFDRVVLVDPGRAWMAIGGLNLDGSRYQFSQLWLRKGGGWHEVVSPTPEQARTMPAGFPPLPFEYETVLSHQADHDLVSWSAWAERALRTE